MTRSVSDSSPRRRYAARQPVEVRREQILNAAVGLVAEIGWAGTAMERIAERAGVAKSVSYKIFGSQAGLQRALMDRAHQVTTERVITAIRAATDADEATGALTAALSTYLDSVVREPEISRLVLLPIEGAPISVQSAIRDGRERVRQQIQTVIEHQLAPIGAEGVDVQLIAHIARDNAEALARLLLEQPDIFTPQRLMRSVDEIVTKVIHVSARRK